MRWLAAVVLIIACEKADTPPDPPPDPLHGIELPEVAGPGYVAAKGDPSILVTTRGFVIDGMAIVSLTNGDVAPDEKEGGALGMKIGRLTTMGAKLAAKHLSPPLVIAFDRRLTYRVLVETLFSLKQKESGWKDFGVLATAKGKTVMVPLSLPDRAPTNDGFTGGIVHATTSRSPEPDAVMAKIKTTYLTSIKRCYKKLLATEPTAHGSLHLSFSQPPTGVVRDEEAHGFAPSLDTCIAHEMKTWRFDPSKVASTIRPRIGPGPTTIFVVTLELAPDGSAPDGVGIREPPPVIPVGPVEEPVKMVVSLMRDNIQVWSISGLEGTLQSPKARIARTDPHAIEQVSTTLAEIVHRRWPSQRSDDRTIIVMMDSNTPMQTVGEIAGAVRAAADGTVLFPDILLSSGFE